MTARNTYQIYTGMTTTGKTTNKKTMTSSKGQGKPESELRAVARRKGLTPRADAF